MHDLRPHLEHDKFVARVKHLHQSNGYQLVFLLDQGNMMLAVAGFHVGENLAWNKYVYLEDLVTAANRRSQGHGKKLLEWIKNYARKCGCNQLHLDSRMHCTEAHVFYEREQLVKAGFHFFCSLQD